MCYKSDITTQVYTSGDVKITLPGEILLVHRQCGKFNEIKYGEHNQCNGEYSLRTAITNKMDFERNLINVFESRLFAL